MTISISAQQKNQKFNGHNFSADQLAEIQTKKMTLYLDLSEAQQQQVFEINKQKFIDHKNKISDNVARKGQKQQPNNEALFKKKSQSLDRQIEIQNKMKNILNKEQFDQWKKARMARHWHIKNRQKMMRIHRFS
jgi:hypothetical protein